VSCCDIVLLAHPVANTAKAKDFGPSNFVLLVHAAIVFHPAAVKPKIRPTSAAHCCRQRTLIASRIWRRLWLGD
jgi:hypothetical protein